MSAGTSPAQRWAIFDMGAVVVRWQPLELVREVLPQRAPDEVTAAGIVRQLFQSFTPGSDWARFDQGLIEVPELVPRLSQACGLEPAQVQRLIDAIPEHMHALQETVEVVRELKAAGCRLAYLSNMPRPLADALEQRHAFLKLFDDGLFSGRVGLIKPMPELFALADRRFARPAGAPVVFIDDHPGNVEAARAHGWSALCFTDAARLRLDLAEAGWPV